METELYNQHIRWVNSNSWLYLIYIYIYIRVHVAIRTRTIHPFFLSLIDISANYPHSCICSVLWITTLSINFWSRKDGNGDPGNGQRGKTYPDFVFHFSFSSLIGKKQSRIEISCPKLFKMQRYYVYQRKKKKDLL